MVNCSVATCKNYARKTVNVVYHVFPKNPSLSSEWVVKCKRADNINIANARVCSDHFVDNDYVEDLQNRLLGLPQRKILKENAVPTVNLGLDKVSATSVNISERKNRLNKRCVRKSALNTIKLLSPQKSSPKKSSTTNLSPKKSITTNQSHQNLSPKKFVTVILNANQRKLEDVRPDIEPNNCTDITGHLECVNCFEKSTKIETLVEELNIIKNSSMKLSISLKLRTTS